MLILNTQFLKKSIIWIQINHGRLLQSMVNITFHSFFILKLYLGRYFNSNSTSPCSFGIDKFNEYIHIKIDQYFKL